MYWILDMRHREDESHISKAQGPLAFSVMRKIAITLFKQEWQLKRKWRD
jgi:predicted transposase YbfD/YdcC